MDIFSSTTMDLLTTVQPMLEETTVFENVTGNGTLAKKGNTNTVLPVLLMFLFGSVGNLLAIFVLLYTAKKHKWRTFYRLVGVLAISDLTGLVVPLSISMANYANAKKWLGGQPLCDFMSFTLILAGMASAMLACCMSLDRFLAVWYPHIYNTKLTKKKTNLIILGVVGTAFFLACLPLIGLNSNIHQFPGTWCFINMFATKPKDKFYACLYALLGIMMIVIMLVCNTMVIVVLAKRQQAPAARRGSLASTKASKVKINDIYNLVFLVVLMTVFTICWVPLCVRILIIQSNNLPSTDDHGRDNLLVMRLSLVNQILDPWIYILLRKDSIKRCVQFGKRHSKKSSFFNKIGDDTEENTGVTSTSASNATPTDSPNMSLNNRKLSLGKDNKAFSVKYSPVAYPKRNDGP